MKALLKLAVILFMAEFAVMCMLPLLGLHGIREDAVDALLLAIIALPALYGLGFRTHRLIDAQGLRHGTRLERKMFFLLGANVLLLLAVVAIYGSIATGQESGARVINVAGRQRMLSQRLVQAAMGEAMEAAHAQITGREPRTPTGNVARIARQFDSGLRLLMEGDPKLGFPPCSDEEAILQLEAVAEAWKPLRAISQRTSEPEDMDEGFAYYAALRKGGDRVLGELEPAVKILEDHYTSQARILSSSLGLTIVAAAAVGLMLAIVMHRVMDHRRKLTAALAQSEAKTRAIVDGAADGIITIDQRGIIEAFNAAAECMFGYTADTAIGKNVSILMPPPHREEHDGYLQRYFNTGEATVIGTKRELLGRHKGGSTFPIELHVSEVRVDARTLFTGIVRDITERKRASRELHGALQAAQAANTAKSEFLANMSHEIRTPMTAILGFTENLLDPELSDSEKLNAIHIIRGNGEHLLQIINDILDISRIEAGKLEVEQIRCSPVHILADVQSLMRMRADDKGLSFAIEYIGAIPETIRSDPMRFKQILVNLIGNAIKFTDDGGVRLVVRLLQSEPIGRTGPDEPMLQLDVIDSGIGVTQEQVARLFQAFTQANASTTRKFGGTGLGLAISKRLANLLGGDISVTSKPAEGSMFRITVATGPLDGVKMLDNPALATIVKPEDAARAKPDEAKLDCRILLAEDGPDNQRLICHVLKKAGADVTVVENGRLAADAALAARDEGSAFHVILMDMQMPVMDGYQATALLRQKGYAGPIIALTAHAMASDRQKCIEAGCDDYASKPIDRKKLIKMIQEHRDKWLLSEKGGVAATGAHKAPAVLLSTSGGHPDEGDT